jgi:predicted transcriptional regulator
MKESKKRRLEKAGWKVGTVQEFLGLSDEDMALIELKRSLIRMLKETREANKVTQRALARMIQSSQSRVAKIEGASSDVSLDLIVKALFALGVTPKKLAKFVATDTLL